MMPAWKSVLQNLLTGLIGALWIYIWQLTKGQGLITIVLPIFGFVTVLLSVFNLICEGILVRRNRPESKR